MPQPRRFSQLDVFTAVPLVGNPLAVVHDAGGLSDEQMAAFARWTNLSETTFLLPPTSAGADYRVRIFTPQRELPFAGHPTLGSCHAWLGDGCRARRDDEVVQQCGVGLVRIRRDGARLAFAAPPLLRSGPLAPELLARIVRGADTDARTLTPESSGLYATASGFREITRDDVDNMARQFPMYDALYAWCRSCQGETHDGPPPMS